MYWAAVAVFTTVFALAVGHTAWESPASPLPQAGPIERVPVVVELFTSEGCSSCPPADEVLTRLVTTEPVAGARIIALGEHVDYWDRLGWRDPFSSPTFSARQSEYASKAFHTTNIYTPQLIVNGREELIGSDYGAAAAAIAKAARQPALPIGISLSEQRGVPSAPSDVLVRVEVPGGSSIVADVFVAVTEDALVTQVRQGENRGRQLRHSAVVRTLTALGTIPGVSGLWSSAVPLRLASDWNVSRLHVVAFAQDQMTRKILGAVSTNLVAKTSS